MSMLRTGGIYLVIILDGRSGEADSDARIDFGHLLGDITFPLLNNVAFVCNDNIPLDDIDFFLVLFVGGVCCDEDF